MRSKNIGSLIFSTFFKLFAMTFVCFLASSFIFSVFGSQPVRVFIQAACILVTMGIIYSPLHLLGGTDRNLVDAGQMKPNMLKGLYIGLAADSPFIISGLLLILSKAGLMTQRYYGVYKLINSIYYPLNFSILPSDETILTVGWGAVTVSILALFIFPIVTEFAYLLGYHRFLFKEAVFYKKKT